MLAGILDAVNTANYQRGGGKGRSPKPVPRPANPTSQASHADAGQGPLQRGLADGFEMDAVSLDEVNQWLGVVVA